VAFVSVLIVLGSFGVFQWAILNGESIETARTLVVNTLVVMEIFYLFSVRYSHGASITIQGIVGTPAVLTGVGIVLIGQALFTFTPVMQAVFGSVAITINQMLVITFVGILLLIIVEIEKFIGRQFVQKR
jgi:magnesium-transporting ATPase (P-type)